jgi:hypothetical protein
MTAQAVAGGDAICNAIEDYLDTADELVGDVAWEATQQHLEDLRSQAARHPRWAPLAPHLSVWANEDGHPTFGVHPSHPRAPEAAAVEYGDGENAPAPLMRMGLIRASRDVGWAMTQAFQAEGYI